MSAGSVLWVIGALAVSTAAGVGAYAVIKEARTASAADEVPATASPPAPPPVEPAPATEPTPEPAPEPPAAAPGDPLAEQLGGAYPDDPADTIGIPGVAGGLDAAAVRALLQTAVPRLVACSTGAGGKVGVMLEVNRRGGVTSAKPEGEDAALAACAANVLKQLRFARTTDGGTATVFVPMRIAPAKAPCDEVSCVLDNDAGPCCAQYKRGGADTVSAPLQPGREEIVAALRPDRRAVSSCAVAASFEGTLKVKFTITPEGTVSKVAIDDVEPALTACVARVIKKHTFSKSQQGVSVSFPFLVPL